MVVSWISLVDDQLGAQLVLQRADVGADGGLGQIEGVGGLGEALEPGHMDEYLQLLDLHMRSFLFSLGVSLGYKVAIFRT